MAEPTTRFSGVKAARTRPAGGATFEDIGDLHEDSEIEYDMPDDAVNSLQEALYAGEFKNVTLLIFDMSTYQEHRDLYKNDDRIDLELELMEGETLLLEGVLPRSQVSTRQGAVGGRNTWELSITKFGV